MANSDGQAQLREVTLQEENAAYKQAISNCESKIQEKIQEADLLGRKLEVTIKVPSFTYVIFSYYTCKSLYKYHCGGKFTGNLLE